MKSHYLEKKSPKNKRRFSKDAPVDKSNVKAIKQLLGMK